MVPSHLQEMLGLLEEEEEMKKAKKSSHWREIIVKENGKTIWTIPFDDFEMHTSFGREERIKVDGFADVKHSGLQKSTIQIYGASKIIISKGCHINGFVEHFIIDESKERLMGFLNFQEYSE